MLNKLLFFLFTIILNWSFTQKTTPYPMDKSSLLWKIEGNGVKKGTYLFGTMHLIEKENFIFPDKLEKIFKKCDVLVMELPGLPNQLEAMKLVQLKEGSFFDYFNEAQTDTILSWAKEEMNMSEEKFRSIMSKMKPFVVVQMATQLHFMGKTESYEMTFDRMAREKNMSILGLETVAEQMAIFDNLTAEKQTEMVMSGIRDMEESISLTKTMQELYVRQNVDSLYMLIQQEGGVLSEEQQNFLDKRNSNWIPKIIDIIEEKKAFIAVGAGHLGGPNGVIRLLEKKGYIITPVEL
jgi:uncharacterized protein YbaP (TraB family)